MVTFLAVLSPFRTVGRQGSAIMAEATTGWTSSNKLTSVESSAKLYIAERPDFGSVSYRPASDSKNFNGLSMSRPIRKR